MARWRAPLANNEQRATNNAFMFVVSLQSGSNGNCIFVEAGGVRLVFDAGIGAREAERRLGAFGGTLCGAHALVLSHNHTDHVRSAGAFHRLYGVPLYMTHGTHRAVRHGLGRTAPVGCFRPGQALSFGEVTVQTIPTPHDGADGVAFVVEHEGCRLGILTDLGHVFAALKRIVPTLDAVLIESNYDPRMLEDGPYPWDLQERIRGRGGHLSNDESAALLRASGNGRLQWACLAHLSANNNTPELALAAHQHALGDRLPLHVASRYESTGPLHILLAE
jgi:phosphoribosyl 1,2-cyclic phosphodiesterase